MSIVCCSVVQCGAVLCRVVQCGAVWCSVVQCGAVGCSVLQWAAICYRAGDAWIHLCIDEFMHCMNVFVKQHMDSSTQC